MQRGYQIRAFEEKSALLAYYVCGNFDYWDSIQDRLARQSLVCCDVMASDELENLPLVPRRDHH